MTIHIDYPECGAEHKLRHPCVTPQLLFPARRKSPGMYRKTVVFDVPALYFHRASSILLDVTIFESSIDMKCAAPAIYTYGDVMSQGFSDTLSCRISPLQKADILHNPSVLQTTRCTDSHKLIGGRKVIEMITFTSTESITVPNVPIR
jgi:hypothetical protein